MAMLQSKGPQNQGQKSIFTLCGEIDLCLRQMNPKSILICGKSRSGKSTLFNLINNVKLMGVSPQQNAVFGKKTIDVEYQFFIQNAEKAHAKSGIISVTLLPNIIQKDSYTMIDLAGFGDTRKSLEVVGVSYVLKAIYHKLISCQFALVVRNEQFGLPQQLFRSLKQFLKMFNYKEMSDQVKEALFKSITFVITKSDPEYNAQDYANFLIPFIDQINDPDYGDDEDADQLTEILTYFSQHPQQFYLFQAAVLGKKAQQSTIVQDHFDKRSYFQFQKQNLKFLQQHKKDIFHLPFQEDFEKIKRKDDKQNLENQLTKKINTIPVVASILQQFFKKAIQSENLLDPNLEFSEQFKLMDNFNKEEDVYPKEFNYRCEGTQENKFPTIFSKQDPKKQLKVGITLAQNSFKLYNLFNQFPVYNHDNQSSKLEEFMEKYKGHLVQIVKLFRDSFCSTYQQEQIILRFLFIIARTCREFSMLYQIRPNGKHEMCLKMKDSFESKTQQEPYKSIQIKFIKQLDKKIDTVCKKIESQREEALQYLKYLNEVITEFDCAQIANLPEYKNSKRRILEIIGEQATSPEEALPALYDNFIEHKKTAQQVINKMNDEEQENYPDEVNFKFIHLLSEMARILLNLQRPDNYAEDLFAYERAPRVQIKRKTGQIKLQLIKEQASLAQDIYIYIHDVEAVYKTYEAILKNIPEKHYSDQVEFLKGLAQYCSKNGRIEQSITLYQKALSVCATGNLVHQYNKIKGLIGQVENTKQQRFKNYFGLLKHKKIIDPTDDPQLDRITDDIYDLFVKPYKEKKLQ